MTAVYIDDYRAFRVYPLGWAQPWFCIQRKVTVWRFSFWETVKEDCNFFGYRKAPIGRNRFPSEEAWLTYEIEEFNK